MKTQTKLIGDLTAKVIAGLLILFCIAIGAIGLILPVIPGLLFLAFAALIIAKHSSWAERWLRKSRTMSGYLDSADGFLSLPGWEKVRYGAWLCLKMVIDGTAYAVTVIAKIVKLGAARYRPSA